MEKAVLVTTVSLAAPFLSWVNICLTSIMFLLFAIFCIQLWIVYTRCKDRKKRLLTILAKHQRREPAP